MRHLVKRSDILSLPYKQRQIILIEAMTLEKSKFFGPQFSLTASAVLARKSSHFTRFLSRQSRLARLLIFRLIVSVFTTFFTPSNRFDSSRKLSSLSPSYSRLNTSKTIYILRSVFIFLFFDLSFSSFCVYFSFLLC